MYSLKVAVQYRKRSIKHVHTQTIITNTWDVNPDLLVHTDSPLPPHAIISSLNTCRRDISQLLSANSTHHWFCSESVQISKSRVYGLLFTRMGLCEIPTLRTGLRLYNPRSSFCHLCVPNQPIVVPTGLFCARMAWLCLRAVGCAV